MVTQLSLGARGKDRLRQLLGLLQPLRQLDAADSTVLLIALPAAAGDVATDDALHRQHGQLLAHHAVALELRLLEELRHILIINGNHVIWHNISSQIKPELGHLGKYLTLLSNLVLENVVKCGNTVSSYHDDAIACIVYLTNLT